ncbi:PREDICTED: uncharacterized protein LOC109156731 [Ipomoea nil]|uniref:uncharacterized protein LOC109156731 n=1 Tax=Ipomoea nil TaxID=35883 RepID=UPI0009013DBA|nr:PREDICTED: uncharacterized protein LOC109156731 [Ipomoea nil]
MSTLSWKCRGLGNPRTVREIVDIVSRKEPDFVFLMETKVARIHAERLRIRLGFEGVFYVGPVGLSGGLALLWRKNCTARLLSFSKNYVDVEVSMTNLPNWRMTCYYGFPERNRRVESWELLKSLAPRSNLPWVMVGDFNDLLFQYEKRGGNQHPNNLLRGFGETIEHCGLSQLPMNGYQFTWEKGKGTPNWIEERLDKVLANETWRDLITGARVYNLLTRKSDHFVIFLAIRNNETWRGRGMKRFRFEMAWLYDDGCRAVVEKSWEEKRVEGMQNCIEHCGNRLTQWGGDWHHKFGEKIMKLRKEQQRLRGRTDTASLTQFHGLEEALCRIEAQEDVYWRQRAKQHWLKHADANTIFYHRYASHRKRILPPEYLTYKMNPFYRPFEIEEVRDALFTMFPDKAPGPDVLIPKKNSPEMVSDLRPIALSNVMYRVVAKMISHRMKPIMDKIISESQSAFIPGRLIIDNILIDSEATVQEATEIKNCLSVYESLSGQVVNYHKSSICYSKNTDEEEKEVVAQVLGVSQARNFGKYLGPPSFIGRNKKAAFSYIEDKITQRIGSWNKKLLSQAGKEVLLKSVAQAMSTFSMRVFLLPLSICSAIERLMYE